MNYRYNTLMSRKSFTSDTVEVIDVNTDSPITSIVLTVEVDHSTAEALAHPAEFIDKVEVVDGSDVVLSISGKQAQALFYWVTGKMPHNLLDYLTTDNALATIPILFGRMPYDPELALVSGRLRNPQLKISVLADPAGNGNVNSVNVSAYAVVFDQKSASPRGYMMYKEHYVYGLTGNAHEYVDLPIDYAHRGVMIQALSGGQRISDQLSHLKLDENMNSRIVADQDVLELMQFLKLEYGEISESVIADIATSSTDVHVSIASKILPVFAGISAAEVGSATVGAGGVFSATESSSAKDLAFLVKGYFPHGTIYLPFGDMGNWEDWYNVRSLKNLRLDLTAAGSPSGDASIVTDQLRTY